MRFILKPFLFIVCILYLQNGNSQVITWGEDPLSNTKNSYFLTVGENTSGIFMLSHKSRKSSINNFSIELYNHQLLFKKRKNFKFKKQQLERVNILNNNLFMATSPTKASVGDNTVSGYLLDENLDYVNKNTLLITVNSSSKKDVIFFKVKPSYDKSGFGVLAFKSANGETEVNYKYFDSLMVEKLSKNFILDYEFEEADVFDYYIDNSGNFYIVNGKINKDLKKGEGRFETQLVYYNFNQDKLENIAITEPRYSAKELTFSYDDSINCVIVSGFFGLEINDFHKGIFQIGINSQNGNIEFNSFTDIPMDFVSDVIGEKSIERGQLLKDYFIHRVVRTADSRSIIVAEHYYTNVVTDVFWSNGFPVNMTRYIYHYDEILLICLDTTGNICWNKVIKKQQTSQDDNGYFSSFLLCTTPNFLSIIYNNRMGGARDVIQYLITDDGDVTTDILLPAENYFTYIVPIEGRQIGYDRLVVPVLRQRDYSLIKITYKEES